MNKILQVIVVFIMSSFLFAVSYTSPVITEGTICIHTGENADFSTKRKVLEVETIYRPENVYTGISDEDIALLALVTMAEAEGESEEGKRLVIDAILNRIDSPRFPDTVYDVVYQKNAFSSVWNGRAERCSVQEDICNLVREELESRLNYDVIYFTAGHYGEYGTPMFSVGNHYFSGY